MRIAINGMGRIGRLLFRRLVNDPSFTLVAVNDVMDTDNLVYLLKYDSLFGKFHADITLEHGSICTGNKTISVLQQDHPSKISWKQLDIDIVLECSGKFTTKAGAAAHLEAGAKKVLLSTTGSADIPLMIYGFNHHQLNEAVDVLSPGGCMTNCATHILYILNSIGIESAQINILHSYTSRQQLVDTWHKQFRRGRAAAESIIPVEIDLSQSLERLLPPLANRIAAVSTRVPVTNGAMADFTVQLKAPATRHEINLLFETAANTEYKGILAYSTDQLVSADIKGDTHSCVIDNTLTSVIQKQVKLIAWFDNEYGYTSRMIDWLQCWKKFID
ncbi:type I glyceraldehyde-3-phosphate dehydrogenase [Panacibacter sp. DH6]|uniref:Type I glyceraldehyde-3-phosphate dehydrogenase n=1 Tax=Panacibacter microcysteis TaxID=2793269 RepID=A0A931EAE6_9BACT|nr:glyceraldehyde 3-phosphate dehydrogenase NAD-binding domain-containing protein [Panacibacter microcysteis]MBG9377169.1 type I glyceraldehyde-3-phosphate dehydrogenase [Panacibacter microcysteis]